MEPRYQGVGAARRKKGSGKCDIILFQLKYFKENKVPYNKIINEQKNVNDNKVWRGGGKRIVLFILWWMVNWYTYYGSKCRGF